MNSLLCFVLNLSQLMDYIKPPFRRRFCHSSFITAVVGNSCFPINLQQAQLQHTLNLQHTVNLGEWESETGMAQWLSGLQNLLVQYTRELKIELHCDKTAALEFCPAGSNLTCKALGSLWNICMWKKGSGVKLWPMWDWGVHPVPSRGATWNHLGSSE